MGQNLEASDAVDEEEMVDWPRPREDLGREGPMTDEQVNVEPVKVESANSSWEKAVLALAAAAFLVV